MARFLSLVLSSGLVALAAAQSPTSSVISIFLPLADQQPLVASVIGGDSAATTMVMQCAPSADPVDCGFPSPITFTAGPSTLHLNPSGIYQALGELDCKIKGNTEATCGLTAGIYDSQALATATGTDYITTPAASSSTQNAVAAGTDFSDALITITITAGEVSGGSATGTSESNIESATGDTSGTSRSGSGSATETSSGTAASSSSNAAAGSFGLVSSAAAAGLVALHMLLL